MITKNTRPRTALSKKLFGSLVVVILVLAGLHLLLQHLNLNVYSELNGRVYELSNRVDFDDENSIPTWVSQALFLSIAGAAFLAAYLQKQTGARRIWAIFGSIGVFLSIDEVGSLHEMLLQTIHLLLFGETAPTVVSNAWVVLLPFVLIAAVLLLRAMLKYVPKRTIVTFVVGGAIFLVGAIFIDILTNADVENTFYARGILVALEESFELLGTSIVLFGIVDYIEQTYAVRIKKALKELKG